MKQLAIIRVRGTTSIQKPIKDTLTLLNLHHINNCVLLPRNETYLGMLKTAKDYITWGEVSEENEQKLRQKQEKKIIRGKEELSKTIRLQPPRGGHARKGVKRDYSIGGALGYRGEDINKLIEKML